MIIDTSAIIAVLRKEPGYEQLQAAFDRDEVRLMSAATLLEASIVLEMQAGPSATSELDVIVQALGIQVVPFDLSQMAFARDAYRRFGKGRHPAALNFGDCFSYAACRSSGEPLLFVGSDFSKTDIAAVEW